mmetsp:Transcript_23844/g.38217  ORF Transcript_23844/g.38217 Transcript_23844/m.38217 type:complete len:110 (-) Transcript_23844:8-337(-)
MMPSSIREAIDETVFWIPDKIATAKDKEADLTQQYVRSLAYFLITVIGVYIFMTYGQYVPRLGVFPGYDGDIQCPTRMEQQTSWVCSFQPWNDDCFPIGGSSARVGHEF